MNELTDEQIENIYLDHRDQLPNIPLIRAIITADRAQRQAEQEPAAAIAALERIAGDLQTLCDKQALMLGERDAQLEAVGADCESWYKQNQQSIDDANKFGGERDSAWAEVERLKADALRAAVAPDSWVLVPLEPTAEMLQAGQDAPVSESDEDAPEDYKAVYRAMLAAAPRHHQADDVCQNRTLRGGTLIDMVRDVEKHHGIGGEPQQIAGLDRAATEESIVV